MTIQVHAGYYIVGPLNFRFNTLGRARTYARHSSMRRGVPVWIRSEDNQYREEVRHHWTPMPLIQEDTP